MNLKPSLLKVLAKCNGRPYPFDAVFEAVRILNPDAERADVLNTLTALSAAGHALATYNDVAETNLWVITDKGRLAAAQL